MGQNFSTFTFTDSVKAAQEHYGSRKNYAGSEDDPDRFTLTQQEVPFIESRDNFYMSTVGENGWPYMQFRGGPTGFLKVVDERTIGFADFRGNKQYISTGNLNAGDGDGKAMLFLIDYPTRQRLKIWATGEVRDVDDDPQLAEQLVMPDYRGKVERLILYTVQAIDWNCPQHITRRYSIDEIEAGIAAGDATFVDLFRSEDSGM
jgi:predicted pyridoxine 5'-phosphate oxidase superfamily flavin-nucleotide-binding protein